MLVSHPISGEPFDLYIFFCAGSKVCFLQMVEVAPLNIPQTTGKFSVLLFFFLERNATNTSETDVTCDLVPP